MTNNNTHGLVRREHAILRPPTPGLYIHVSEVKARIADYERIKNKQAGIRAALYTVNPQSVQSSQLLIFAMSVTARYAIRLAQPRLASSCINRYSPVRFTYRSQQQYRSMSSTQIPTTMRGVLVEKVGGPEVLEFKTDLPVPKPGAGEVLVKNELAGLNYIDT